jgi:hypothetical protein
VFIGGVNKGFQIVQEFLKLVPVKGRAGAEEVFFKLVSLFCKYKFPLKNSWDVSDSAPAMVGEKNGAKAKLQNRKLEVTIFLTPIA